MAEVAVMTREATVTPTPSIQLRGSDIVIAQTLQPDDLRRLLVRVFQDPMVQEIHSEPDRLRLSLKGALRGPEGALERLARLLREAPADPPVLAFEGFERVTTVRCLQGVITRLDLRILAPGLLRLQLPKRDSKAVIDLSLFPGVRVSRGPLSRRTLRIRHDPVMAIGPLIRALEQQLDGVSAVSINAAPRVPFAAANANLALCTTGQFFFPPAIPWVSGVLVLTRLPHLRHAARELRQGTVGAPFFGAVVLTCSVAAMAPFASALAEWLGCVFERRWRRGVNRQTRLLTQQLSALAPFPATVAPVTLRSLETVPFDGVIETGAVLVQDALTDPLTSPKRKLLPGMTVTAGHRVLAGEARLLPAPGGPDSRVRQLTHRIAALPSTLPGDPILTAEARRVADQAVYPNLALAGLAASIGGLHMASAILHQDWSTSPVIVSPTEFFHDLRAGLQSGLVMTHPRALKALAAARVLIIDLDFKGVTTTALRVSDVEAPGKAIIRTPGWAGALAPWLGEARGAALRDLARVSPQQDVPVTLLGMTEDSLSVRIEDRTVVIRDRDPLCPEAGLRLEIEGEGAEVLSMEPTDQPLLGPTFDALRALGLRLILVGGTGDTAALRVSAARLGAAAVYPGLRGAALEDLVQAERAQGGAVAVLGPDPDVFGRDPETDLALVPLALMPDKGLAMGLLGEDLTGLPGAILQARTHPARVQLTALATLPTNLVCIVGGFAGAVNGVLATVLSNTGVLGVSLAQGRRIRAKAPLLKLRSAGLSRATPS